MRFLPFLLIALALPSPASAEEYNSCKYAGQDYSHGGTLPNGQTCEDGQWRGQATPDGGGIPLGFGNSPCDDPNIECNEN